MCLITSNINILNIDSNGRLVERNESPVYQKHFGKIINNESEIFPILIYINIEKKIINIFYVHYKYY